MSVGAPHEIWTSAQLATVPLETVERHWRLGLVSDVQWTEYKHTWQTSAPRFGRRVCQCHECVKSFPDIIDDVE